MIPAVIWLGMTPSQHLIKPNYKTDILARLGGDEFSVLIYLRKTDILFR